MISTTGACASINWANTSKKCARRKRIFRNSPSASRWKWITCPATRNGFANWPTLHPWDYFIGSVHYVSDSWAIDNPYKLSEWKNRDVMEVWSIYFERLTMAAEIGLFEIIGHADLPKKFGHRPTRRLHADI